MARVPRHLVAVLLSALVSLAGCAAPDAGDLRAALVPVAAEAWFAWGLMRMVPGLGVRLGARLHGAWAARASTPPTSSS